ncbi:3-isopropylmalate dehydrogenase [Rhizobium sp. ERR 922]|uniref:3-isopropylmalate dehydrogenase n=1 Tax=unclassified Rhizobium TaxID=2613769 RepID=UPI0011A25903|nr:MULTISPECIES: 3-isopropylmalate dehydrogenase [unclassified Rhizobium]TWB53117.1 3-isopropylmalate dehydrogenase [Rhizobium sp. ERR 922]TWB95918.1 3-isopropylmalate dehydrogenase [Rhizobium sp. ERR 942]
MEPFVRVEGVAATLMRPNVDTEVMIRINRLIDNPRGKLGPWLFEAWRYDASGKENPEFELNDPRFQDARILIAGENFGCGSSREAAAWAVFDYGLRTVIAPSFSDIFRANCFQNGILPIVLPMEQVKALADRVAANPEASNFTVDLENCEIVTPEGNKISFSIEAERREALLAGLDEIGMTLRMDQEIREFQKMNRQDESWIYPSPKPGPAKLLVLAGDGVGPEILTQVRRIISWFSKNRNVSIDLTEEPFGVAAWAAHGNLMRDETWQAIQEADAILFGAISFGSKEYDHIPAEHRTTDWLLKIRKELDLFNNLRPVKTFSTLVRNSTLRPEVIDGADMVIVRELAGGIYFGSPRGPGVTPDGTREAVNTLRYSEPEVARIARAAFELARQRRGKLCSVDKANVLEVGALWRKVVCEVHEAEYPDVELTHMYVDNCAMQLVRNPKQFDVIVTENLFGDILSDCAAMVSGSLGMLPSASLSAVDVNGKRHALYEPIHGSAPDIAGKNIANPSGAILSFAMCLRHSLNKPEEANLLESAVEAAIGRGIYTADIAPPGVASVSTTQMGDAVLEELERLNA